jgi:uncharacterized protein (DUF302 family)
MTEYGRRIVVDLGFEAALGATASAIAQQGLQIIARIDVRDHFWRDAGHDFRQYFLMDAWSSELAIEALRRDLDIGAILPTTFGVYELADGETAVVAREPLLPLTMTADWRRQEPALAALADLETERVARVFAALEHRAAVISPAPAAFG